MKKHPDTESEQKRKIPESWFRINCRTWITVGLIMGVLIGTLYPSLLFSAETGLVKKQITLPMNEVLQEIIQQLKNEGYGIQKKTLEMGKVLLTCEKKTTTCTIRLQPYSPLATEISVLCRTDNQPDSTITDEWVAALFSKSAVGSKNDPRKYFAERETAENDLSKNNEKNRDVLKETIPARILSLIESVVCIKATIEDNEIQFSGFLVDKNGIILSTAHDLTNFDAIKVILFDGEPLAAKVLAIDTRRDLLLLQADIKSETFIPLSGGNALLGLGERIYSAGCPLNLRGTIYTGLVNGPPRKLNGLPLWQVNMEIHHGSSGGPVFNSQGQLVAIVKGRFRGTETIGFLIPMETIIEFLKEQENS